MRPDSSRLQKARITGFEYANASYKDFVKRDDLIGKTVAEAMPESRMMAF